MVSSHDTWWYTPDSLKGTRNPGPKYCTCFAVPKHGGVDSDRDIGFVPMGESVHCKPFYCWILYSGKLPPNTGLSEDRTGCSPICWSSFPVLAICMVNPHYIDTPLRQGVSRQVPSSCVMRRWAARRRWIPSSKLPLGRRRCSATHSKRSWGEAWNLFIYFSPSKNMDVTWCNHHEDATIYI